MSARKITVSTVGLPKAIRRLADEDLSLTLAISLHAPNDALRQQLIPAARQYPLADIIAAAQAFYRSRHREVTLEYTLLAGVNDSSLCADQLAKLAGQLRCNVNLIRYNPVETLPYAPPGKSGMDAFAEHLIRRHVNVNIRRSRGAENDAACGQLRKRLSNGTDAEKTDPTT